MKKMVFIGLAALMMCSNVFAGDISVNLDGEAVEFTGQEPVIADGRTLIPLRGVFEKLGYEISWDNNTKTAEFEKEGTKVSVTVDSEEFSVNGESIKLDVPAQIINGSMMLPLRAIGEATGLTVNWDGESKSVNIDSGSANNYGDATTEVLTEESTETTTQTVKSLSDDEIKKHVDGYITYTRASSLASAVISDEVQTYHLLTATEDGEEMFLLLNLAIEVEEMYLEKVNDISVNEYTKDIVEDLKNVINVSMDFHKLMLNVLLGNTEGTSESELKNSLDKAWDEYNDAIYDFQIALEKYGEAYAQSIEEFDWDFDDLTDEQQAEERAYQKKVGDLLESAFDVEIADNEDVKSLAKKIRNTADKIRNGMAELTPPDFAAADDDILIAGCDFLDEAADIYEKDDQIEYFYVTSLLIAFDACAKSCAGDYYVSSYFS